MANSSSGGKSLGGLVRAYSAMQRALYKPPKNTIDGVTTSGAWPSALNPIQPTGPKGSQPLAFSYWEGLNLEITPRADMALTFDQLRDLGTYPLARICIENVKDIVCSLSWKIQLRRIAGEPVAEWKDRQKKDTGNTVTKLTDFMSYPDGETPWSDWLRPILEDLLVIDAPSILVDSTLDGKVVGLRWTDGSDILRLITDRGYTPQGDNPAFTQLWEGIPRLLLTTQQLVYRPSNIVPRVSYFSKLYGMSITEQLAQEILVGQERLNFITAYYKDGITGGLIHVVPSGVTPDKVSENQQSFNALMSGNLGQRRKFNVLQGYQDRESTRPEQIIETKEPVLADVFDDLHIRKIAFGYGVSAQRLMKQMNRASAEAGQDASEKEGLMPRLKWLKGTMDLIIQRRMGFDQYEMVFDTDDELDASKQAEVDTTNVKSGLRTIDETRLDRGLPPFGIPETAGPIIILPTGVQPLAGSFDRTQQTHDADIKQKNTPKPAPVIAGSAAGKKALHDYWYSRSGY